MVKQRELAVRCRNSLQSFGKLQILSAFTTVGDINVPIQRKVLKQEQSKPADFLQGSCVLFCTFKHLKSSKSEMRSRKASCDPVEREVKPLVSWSFLFASHDGGFPITVWHPCSLQNIAQLCTLVYSFLASMRPSLVFCVLWWSFVVTNIAWIPWILGAVFRLLMFPFVCVCEPAVPFLLLTSCWTCGRRTAACNSFWAAHPGNINSDSSQASLPKWKYDIFC